MAVKVIDKRLFANSYNVKNIQSEIEIMTPPGMEEMTNQLQGMFQNLAGNTSKKKKLKIQQARQLDTFRTLL